MSGESESAPGKPLPLHDPFSQNLAFLLRRAQEASFAAFAGQAHMRGLKPGHFAVLRTIAANEGLSQKDLSAIVGRDKATITPMVQDFERNGLVIRALDPRDSRGRCVSLTPKGHQLLETLALCASAHDAALEKLAGDDRDAIIAFLRKVSTSA